ncbi:MAG: ATP synthase F1 subunit epsilon [Hyphomicrobiaceae bacterium]|nr:ATP synthase F1 subunit epsilon [Hyphomicrobiaceae bacterium]
MAQTFTFELVSPERVLLSVEAEQVELPGTDGDMTVLAGHAPVVAALRPGTIHSRTASGKTAIFVQGGIADVRPGAVVVLAEKAFATDEVDVRQIERELEATQTALDAAADDEARRHLGMAIDQMKAILAARQKG